MPLAEVKNALQTPSHPQEYRQSNLTCKYSNSAILSEMSVYNDLKPTKSKNRSMTVCRQDEHLIS